MRRVGELSPADWPRVFHGVRWDGRGRGLGIAAGLIAALLCSLVLASSALAAGSSVRVLVVGKGSARAVKAAGGKVTRLPTTPRSRSSTTGSSRRFGS